MRKYAGEAILAIAVTLALAEGMQILWRLSVLFHDPLDKIFIAAGSICYLFYRLSEYRTGATPWGGE
jgi:hypothetical protein